MTCSLLTVNFTRLSLGATSVLVVLSVFTPALVQARVGETQDVIERRLLQPGVGKLFNTPKPMDPKAAARQQQKDAKDQPFHSFEAFLPTDIREGVYWKSAVANQLSNDSGWQIYVFYSGGRSVLEAYKRVGDGLNEFEIKGLLNVNRGTSSWKKNDGSDSTAGIDYDYELEDGSLRAKVDGNWFMIFAKKLDAYVVDQKRIAKAVQDRELALQKKEQAVKAPESISGL